MKATRIVSDPKILGGKPVIAGTRISVELIMDFLAAGLSIEEILENYPHLKKEEVQAAIEFAAAKIKGEEFHPVVEKDGRIIFPTF